MGRSFGIFAAPLLVLCASIAATAQQADPKPTVASTPRAPLLAPSPHLALTLPPPSSAADPGSNAHWLLVPITLTPPPLLAATLIPAAPLHTADGELATYVASLPLVGAGPVTLGASGSVAEKIELDCRSTCQPGVERAVALDARVVVAGDNAQADASAFVRAEQVSARPNSQRRLRVGVLGAF